MAYAAVMASTKAPPTRRYEVTQPRRAQPPAFPGCKPVHLPRTEIDRFEGRLEYWDAATETAWICEPTTPYHERPSRLVTRLAELIARVRGSPIECYGSMDLLLRDAGGEPRRIMQADESVYLHPARARLPGPAAMVVGEDDFPDVVLEVDHTTDARRGQAGTVRGLGLSGGVGGGAGRAVAEPGARAAPGADDSCAGAWSVPGGGREPGVSRLAGGRDSRGVERAGAIRAYQRGGGAGRGGAGRARRDWPGRRPAVALATAPGVRARSCTDGPSDSAVTGTLRCRRGSPPTRRRSPRRPRRRCWRRRLAARMRGVSLPRSGELATRAADLATANCARPWSCWATHPISA